MAGDLDSLQLLALFGNSRMDPNATAEFLQKLEDLKTAQQARYANEGLLQLGYGNSLRPSPAANTLKLAAAANTLSGMFGGPTAGSALAGSMKSK